MYSEDEQITPNALSTLANCYGYPGSVAGMPETRADQRLRELRDSLSANTVRTAPPPYPASHIGRAAIGGVDGLERRLRAEGVGEFRPVRLPWRWTNAALGNGLAPGQVTVLAGPAGAAKSYLLLNIFLHVWSQKLEWRLLPLEDDAGRWVQRLMAVAMDSWRMVSQPVGESEEECRELANFKLNASRANRPLVKEMYKCIYENPRLPADDGSGSFVVPEVRYTDVLAMVEGIAGHVALVGIDCLSQVDFSDNGADYLGQADFMRRLVGLAAAKNVHVVLVAHHAKRGKNASGDPLDMIQGSAMFSRLAHNVLALSRHDPARTSQLLSSERAEATHALTLSVLKCRGGHSGQRLAFDLNEDGPTFREHGKVMPMVTA